MGGRLFGCHVSAAGGIVNALKNGEALKINTIQLHPSPPQRWNVKPFPKGIEEDFLTHRPNTGVKRVFFHGIYLLNLASLDEEIRVKSELSLMSALNLLERIQGDGLIIHVGSLRGDVAERVGLRRAATSINRVFARVNGNVPLLLEVSAGSGRIIGSRIEELAEIRFHVEDRARVGFALDTQHLWASGYNIVEDLEGLVRNVETVLGLERVLAIHLNDSKTPLGSRVDRHENIGEGYIGSDALRAFFLHPKFATIPFILETPFMKSINTAAIEVEKLKGFLASAAPERKGEGRGDRKRRQAMKKGRR